MQDYFLHGMICFIGLETKSRKAQDVAAANLFGPGLRAIQRKNAKTRGSNITESDFENVTGRVGCTPDKAYSDT